LKLRTNSLGDPGEIRETSPLWGAANLPIGYEKKKVRLLTSKKHMFRRKKGNGGGGDCDGRGACGQMKRQQEK